MKGRKKRLALLLCMALATNIFVPGGGRAYALETVAESGDAVLESLAAPETGNEEKTTSGAEPGVSAVSGSDAVLLRAKGVEAADPQGEMLVYYIDAEAGDDAADGLSAETPWKSPMKLYSSPGTVFCLRQAAPGQDSCGLRAPEQRKPPYG